MSTHSPIASLIDLRREVTNARVAAAESADAWSVREADVERRLRSLHARAAGLTSQSAPTAPRRNAVALYSSRWCDDARRLLALAK
jgi:hypothetical protein